MYDLDSDGVANVMVRSANGVVFGDRTIFDEGVNDDEQYIAVLDGKTGALRASTEIRSDCTEHRFCARRLGIAILDVARPRIVAFVKNR